MIQLYHGSGAGDFTILQDGLTHDECRVLFENAARVLGARSQTRAAEILRSVPFRVADATNHFNDEFAMLHAVVPLDEYERRAVASRIQWSARRSGKSPKSCPNLAPISASSL